MPVALNGKRFGSPFELFLEANRIGGRHGLGMSDQIENRVIDAKSRGIYEAPGMALLHIVYERLLSRDPQREHARPLLHARPPPRPRCSTRASGSTPRRCMLKDALTRWVAPSVTGAVTLELRRGDDYTILDDAGASTWRYAPEKLSMERVAEPAFTPEDRIGALELQNLSVGDNRALLLHHLDAVRRARRRRRRGPSLAALLGSGDEE